MAVVRLRQRVGRAMTFGLALLLLYPFVRSGQRAEIFVDEVGFISAGHAAVTRLLQGDLNGPAWNAGDWACYGWQNPMLAKLLMGASLYAAGHGGREYGTWVNKLPGANETEVRAARWPGIILGWASCLLLYVIGCRVSVFTGVTGSLYVAYNSNYVWCCALAMLEAPMMFFMMLTLLGTLRLKDSLYGGRSMRRVLVGAVVVGCSAAAAVSSKLNGGSACILAVALPAALAVSGLLGVAPIPRPRVAIAAALTAALVAVLGFYAMNPAFHRQPINQMRQMLDFWSTVVGPKPDAPTTSDRARIVMDYLVSKIPTSKTLFRPLFEVFARRWPAEKNRFESRYIDRSGSVEAVLLAVALLSIARTRWKRGRRAPMSDEEIFVAFFFIVLAGTIGSLGMIQGRYFVPLLASTGLLVPIGLSALWPLRVSSRSSSTALARHASA